MVKEVRTPNLFIASIILCAFSIKNIFKHFYSQKKNFLICNTYIFEWIQLCTYISAQQKDTNFYSGNFFNFSFQCARSARIGWILRGKLTLFHFVNDKREVTISKIVFIYFYFFKPISPRWPWPRIVVKCIWWTVWSCRLLNVFSSPSLTNSTLLRCLNSRNLEIIFGNH